MLIRTASESDISDMHRIRLSVRENRLADPSAVQPDDYRPLLRERGRGWVAEVDGRIVGFAIADLSRGNIWALFVDPRVEGRGIGRALHDQMIEWTFAAGADRIWLTTTAGTRAERFYRAASWRYAGAERGEAKYEMSRSDWTARRRS